MSNEIRDDVIMTRGHDRSDESRLAAQLKRMTAERNALLAMLVEEGAARNQWCALLPDSSSPLGKSWYERETKAEAEYLVMGMTGLPMPLPVTVDEVRAAETLQQIDPVDLPQSLRDPMRLLQETKGE